MHLSSTPEKNEKHEEKETNGETRPNHQNQAQICQSSQSPQSQSHTQENKNPASAKRFSGYSNKNAIGL